MTANTPEYYLSFARTVAAALPPAPSFNIPLSIDLIANMRVSLTHRGVVANHVFLGSTVWSLLMGYQDFTDMFDPVTEAEVLASGHLGTLFGSFVFTDCYFELDNRVFTNDLLAVASIDFPSKSDTVVVRDIVAVHCGSLLRQKLVVDNSALDSVKSDLSSIKRHLGLF